MLVCTCYCGTQNTNTTRKTHTHTHNLPTFFVPTRSECTNVDTYWWALMKSNRAIYRVILDLGHIFCEFLKQAKNQISRVNKLESIKIGVVKAIKALRLNTLSQ